MKRLARTNLGRWLALHWVELSIAALSVYVLWQLAPLAHPSAAPTPAGATAPQADAVLLLAAPLPGTTPHSIDSLTVNGRTVAIAQMREPLSAQAGDPLVVNGWAVVGASPARAVLAVIDGSTVAAAPLDVDRPDVANYLRNDAVTRSGFSLALPTAALLPGVHHIAFRIVTPDGTGYYAASTSLKVYFSSAGAPAAETLGIVQTLNGSAVPAAGYKGTTPKVSGDSMLLTGWAVDWAHRTLLQSISAVVDGGNGTPLRYGEARAAVAAYFHDPGFARSGFSGTVDLKRLKPGHYSLIVRGTDIFGGESDYVTNLSFSR